jgi:hypothetical protein
MAGMHFTYRRVDVRAVDFSDIVSVLSAVVFVLLQLALENSTIVSRKQTHVLNSKTDRLLRLWVLIGTISRVEIRIVCHDHERIQVVLLITAFEALLCPEACIGRMLKWRRWYWRCSPLIQMLTKRSWNITEMIALPPRECTVYRIGKRGSLEV